MRKWLFYAFDVSVVASSPFLAVWLRQNFDPSSRQLLDVVAYAGIGAVIAAAVFLVAETHKGIWRYVSLPDFARIITAATVIIVVSWFIIFAMNRSDGIARSVPFIQWSIVISLMVFARLLARAVFRRAVSRSAMPGAVQRESVLVVGLNQVAELYLRCVASLASDKMVVVGLLDEAVHTKGRRIHSLKVLGSPSQLTQILARLGVHGITVRRLVITMPFDDLSETSRNELLNLERSGAIRLDFFSERLGFNSAHPEAASDQQTKDTSSLLSCASLGLSNARVGGSYAGIKRLVDVIAASVLLMIAAPIMLLVAILVAVDLGFPVAFWQERPGKHGRPFRVYKFRTMGAAHDEHGQRIPDDQRHTIVGTLLRRSRFDELPQLINILAGEMSFVGPRPLLPVDQPSGDNPRLLVRPGLTGWAQVNGGNEVSIEDKAAMDIWYIKNMSFALDLKICWRTIDMVINGQKLNRDAIKSAYVDLGIASEPVKSGVGARSAETEYGGVPFRNQQPA